MKVLLTGCAGFIGMHVAKRLLDDGYEVTGIDNLNDYYAVELKLARLATLQGRPGFTFHKLDIAQMSGVESVFTSDNFDYVIHLAAQAGVRYSILNPDAYTQSNLVGFANMLEACRRHPVKHFVFASSSSVYGQNEKVPFSENDRVDLPVSYYAATKKANEVMAASYAHLYRIPVTGLRFFTVYGPWGRPDMAPWLFTEAILHGKPIKVFNYGELQRDFTYIDDIVEGIFRVMLHAPQDDLPYNLFNIGNHNPVALIDFIKAIEISCGIEAKKEYLPMQDGDVAITYADTEKLRNAVGFSPSTSLQKGIQNFTDWYIQYKRGSRHNKDALERKSNEINRSRP